MQTYLTLVRREMGGYFNSVLGYVIIAAAMFLMGLSFVVLLGNLRSAPMTVTLTELFFMTWYFWMIMLLGAPVITMRLFALERFSGTYESLMTTPVKDVQVVMAKYTAAMLFFILLWLPLLACLYIVQHYAVHQGTLDLGIVGSAYLGIVLVGSVLISMGCLGSAVTKSQTVAAIIGLGLGMAFLMVSFLSDQIKALPPIAHNILAGFLLLEQMSDFSRGVIDTRPVVFHITLTFLFLFFTLRAIESRRWK